jgi:tetratricopeptide (TPR) repeat protein
MGAMAQSAKVVSAYNTMKSGEFDKAKDYIDAAITHEKTMGDEKTWRYRGEIYYGIAASDADFGVDKVTAINEAIKSYNKALELDIKEKWVDESRSGLGNAQVLAVNMGIVAYNEANYTQARDVFKIAADAAEDLGAFDTLSVYNGGLAAEQAEDYDAAVERYMRCTDVGYLGPKMYLYIANIYQKTEQPDKFLEIVQAGRVKYPEDSDLIVYELNYYLRNNKYEEAENNLKLAIEKEPNNKQLHFSLGVVYDNLGRKEDALAAYSKAIEIDPEYFDAVYNLGAMYFNEGVEMNNAANEIEDNKAYAAKREEAKAVFREAKPHLEKAHELDPTDLGAMSSLSQLYALLGETEKYTEMKAKLEAAK